MNRYTLLLPIFLILLLLFAGISIVNTDPMEPVLSGVPHNVVYGAHCDALGNCWFATWGGVGVYSRSENRWASFTTTNSELADKYTHDVALDDNGLVWIALHSGNGVNLLDYNGTLFDKSDDHWDIFPGTLFPAGFGWTETITVASDGGIWIGHSIGASRLDYMGTPWVKHDDQWSHFSNAALGLGLGFVNIILEDGGGCLWFGGEDGLGNNCEIFVPAVDDSDVPTNCPACCWTVQWIGFVWDLAFDQEGDLWVADGNCGAAELDGSSWNLCDVHDPECGLPPPLGGTGDEGLRSVAVDDYNNVWFGTRGRGVARADNFSDWTLFTTEDGWLTASQIEDIEFDQAGDGWFATFGGGVSLYRPATSTQSQITPAEGGEIVSPDSRVKASFGPGSVTMTTTVTMEGKGSFPTGIYYSPYAFDLTTTPAYTSTEPYTLTVLYTEQSLPPVDEDSLSLYWFDGNQWVEESTCIVDSDHDRILATPDHMTIFALLGEAKHVYVPVVIGIESP